VIKKRHPCVPRGKNQALERKKFKIHRKGKRFSGLGDKRLGGVQKKTGNESLNVDDIFNRNINDAIARPGNP